MEGIPMHNKNTHYPHTDQVQNFEWVLVPNAAKAVVFVGVIFHVVAKFKQIQQF